MTLCSYMKWVAQVLTLRNVSRRNKRKASPIYGTVSPGLLSSYLRGLFRPYKYGLLKAIG